MVMDGANQLRLANRLTRRSIHQLILAEITMKAADKLRAYWSKQEDCLEVWHPLGMQTCADANWIIATLNADVIAELERRGYDKTTLRLSIEPKAGNPRFASQRLGENDTAHTQKGRGRGPDNTQD